MLRSLVDRLNELCDAQPFETGWYLKDLTTGDDAARRGDVVVPSASTRKIAIMMTAMRAVHAGRLSLDRPVRIEARYQENATGCFQHLRPGFTLTLHDVLVMMIIVSDNACTGIVADLLGLDEINDFCRSAGMVGTVHRQGVPPLSNMRTDRPQDVGRTNVTTPSDVGSLLDRIRQGAEDRGAAAYLGCTPALCRLAMNILSWQLLNTRLPALLPTGTIVAHKTGTGGRNFHDAGIVFHNERPAFILSVYTDDVPAQLPDGVPGKASASAHIGRLCRRCWDVLVMTRVVG